MTSGNGQRNGETLELVSDGEVWGRLVRCQECSGTGQLLEPWFIDTEENRRRVMRDQLHEQPMEVDE